MEDEVNLEPADSLNFACVHFDKKFEVMQNQINPKCRELPRSRVIRKDYSFKSKDNSLQFNFSSGLQDDLKDILDDHSIYESNAKPLNTTVSKISNIKEKQGDFSLAG